MTEYHIELFFDKRIPRKIKEKIDDEFIESGAYRIFTIDFIIMRTKLIYIPVIMATAVYGQPSFERKGELFSFAEKLRNESESCFTKWVNDHPIRIFSWLWSDEDQEAYEMLKDKVGVKLMPSRLQVLLGGSTYSGL